LEGQARLCVLKFSGTIEESIVISLVLRMGPESFFAVTQPSRGDSGKPRELAKAACTSFHHLAKTVSGPQNGWPKGKTSGHSAWSVREKLGYRCKVQKLVDRKPAFHSKKCRGGAGAYTDDRMPVIDWDDFRAGENFWNIVRGVNSIVSCRKGRFSSDKKSLLDRADRQ